jgi:hypothetical protein
MADSKLLLGGMPRNENPATGRSVGDRGRERNESDWIIPGGIVSNQLCAAHEILSCETHPQLHSLGGSIAIDAPDHLLDLVQVKGGLERNRAGE